MPLTKKGEEILKSMTKEYGAKKGKQVFYASINKGKGEDWHKKMVDTVMSMRRK